MDLFQFADYINVVFDKRDERLRLGQWAVVVLFNSYPDIYNRLNGNPELDPFYTDNKLKGFLQRILDNYVSERIVKTPNPKPREWSNFCERTFRPNDVDHQ